MAIKLCKKTVGESTWVVFHPVHRGIVFFYIIKGKAYQGQRTRGRDYHPGEMIISQLRRGVAPDKARALKCAPAVGRVKSKDCTTLGALFTEKKECGSRVGLRSITEANRYKGKVDWEIERSRITAWDQEGRSNRWMAQQLGVCPSALSKANVKHRLYETRPTPTGKKTKSAPISTGFNEQFQGGSVDDCHDVESNADSGRQSEGIRLAEKLNPDNPGP